MLLVDLAIDHLCTSEHRPGSYGFFQRAQLHHCNKLPQLSVMTGVGRVLALLEAIHLSGQSIRVGVSVAFHKIFNGFTSTITQSAGMAYARSNGQADG